MSSALNTLNEVMAPLMPHLMLAPILLPLLTAALLLLMGEDQPRFKLIVNLLSTLLGLGVALALLGWASQQGAASTMDVYLTGNWPAPYGIVLALDRLSALMLVLTSVGCAGVKRVFLPLAGTGPGFTFTRCSSSS